MTMQQDVCRCNAAHAVGSPPLVLMMILMIQCQEPVDADGTSPQMVRAWRRQRTAEAELASAEAAVREAPLDKVPSDFGIMFCCVFHAMPCL